MATELKPCPFCGGFACKAIRIPVQHGEKPKYKIVCYLCGCQTEEKMDDDAASEVWNHRASETVKVETNFYDKEEIHENCTVQVLTNTATGETSVGWWKNGN